MARPIPHLDRLQIVKLRNQGHSYASISKRLGYSTDGVRKIYLRYVSHGLEGLQTSYHKSGRRSPYLAIQSLVESQRDGDQGAPYIRSVLLSLHPDKPIPHERTIQRWWAKTKEKKSEASIKG